MKQLEQLPDSCAASADCLERQRAVFEQYHVFSPAMVDGVISKLRSYEDRTLRAEIQDSPGGDAETGREVFPLRIGEEMRHNSPQVTQIAIEFLIIKNFYLC